MRCGIKYVHCTTVNPAKPNCTSGVQIHSSHKDAHSPVQIGQIAYSYAGNESLEAPNQYWLWSEKQARGGPRNVTLLGVQDRVCNGLHMEWTIFHTISSSTSLCESACFGGSENESCDRKVRFHGVLRRLLK